MALVHTHRLQLRVASSLLALRLVWAHVFSWISFGVFLYVMNLPLADQVANNFTLAISGAIIFFGGSLQQDNTRKNLKKVGRHLASCGVYYFLVYLTHTNGSALGEYHLIRWLVRVSSTKEAWITTMAFSAAMTMSNRLSSNTLYFWSSVTRASSLFYQLSSLALHEAFFKLQDWIYSRRRFFAGFAFRQLKHLCYHLILQGLLKFAWKSDISWLDWELYMMDVCCVAFADAFITWTQYHQVVCQQKRFPVEKQPKFKYERLPSSRHIRLLLFHPRSPTGPVRCSLVPTLLERAPYYEAMSYTVSCAVPSTNMS
jgi:hypothetical protein